MTLGFFCDIRSLLFSDIPRGNDRSLRIEGETHNFCGVPTQRVIQLASLRIPHLYSIYIYICVSLYHAYILARPSGSCPSTRLCVCVCARAIRPVLAENNLPLPLSVCLPLSVHSNTQRDLRWLRQRARESASERDRDREKRHVGGRSAHGNVSGESVGPKQRSKWP